MTATQWGIWAWGVGGVVLFLANPIVRLGAQTLDGFAQGLDPLQWAVTVVWCGAMFYAEGIRGFHRQFSPRVVVRAEALARRPFGLPTLLAPFTCMGLLHATRKRLIVSWTLLVFIVLLVVGVRQLAQPWRAIVDAGVVVGLFTGVVSIGYHALGTWVGRPPDVPSDMP